MKHAKFSAIITNAEHEDLLKICEMLNISEDVLVAESLRWTIARWAPLLKQQRQRQKAEALKVALFPQKDGEQT